MSAAQNPKINPASAKPSSPPFLTERGQLAEGGPRPLFFSVCIPKSPSVARCVRLPGHAACVTEGFFQMRKKPLRGEQVMSDAIYVDQAAAWARRLTHAEARGPGDMENAWRRLEARYGVSWRTFWALRYRKPKDIATSVYFGILAAYEDQCERQARNLQHEIEIAKAKAGASNPVLVAAQSVVDAAEIEPEFPAHVAPVGD